MGLTQTQKAMVEKARAAGGGGQAISLSDDTCICLIGIIVRDLGLSDQFPELPRLASLFRPARPRLLKHLGGGIPSIDGTSCQIES